MLDRPYHRLKATRALAFRQSLLDSELVRLDSLYLERRKIHLYVKRHQGVLTQNLKIVPHPLKVPLVHGDGRSEEHTSELQSRFDLVCRLLLEKKKNTTRKY